MKLKGLQLRKKTIHVWYCHFKNNKNQLKQYAALLSSDEIDRSRKFKFEKDQETYVITRAVLRILLGKYLKQAPEEINFDYTKYKKPFLTPTNNLKFNVSHSGNMAAFAFYSNREIGVDIEKIKDDFDVLELAQNFFSKKEIEVLEKLPKSELARAFYRCWTRKESFIKAEGSGLSFPLDKFTVSIESDTSAEIVETNFSSEAYKQWSLFSFIPQENYLAAVAVKDQVNAISYFDCDSL